MNKKEDIRIIALALAIVYARPHNSKEDTADSVRSTAETC